MKYSALVGRLAGLGGAMWETHGRAVALQEQGHDVIFLTLGEPDFATPAPIVDAAFQAIADGNTGYAPSRGEDIVVDALAAKYSRRTGRLVGPDQVVFLPGTQTALALTVLALAEAGDDVLVPTPYYATYPAVVAASGARFVTVPLSPHDRFHLQPDALEAAITPSSKVLLLNSPHNPTGATLSKEKLESIADVVEHHDLAVISDEVYESVAFDGPAPSIFDIPRMQDRTVVVSSLSKSHAMTGWRCGWAVGSPDFVEAITPLADAMLFGSQPFLQHAAAAALLGDFPVIDRMRSEYQRRSSRVTKRLADVPLVTCVKPEGGMFLVVDVSATGLDGTEFSERLLDDQYVAVMPGASFGLDASIRISLVADDEALDEACDRIGRFVESQFAR